MTKRNHFTDKFINKSDDELRNIVDHNDYQKDAKLAAIWELERRGKAREEDLSFESMIKAENERKKASRLSGKRYDTFWPRFIAACIDGLVLWPIGYLLKLLGTSDIGSLVIITDLLNNLSPYIYAVLMHGKYGQTVGKMAMGVRVVDFQNEESITYKRALIRDSVPLALLIVFYVYSWIILSDMEHVDMATDFVTLAPLFLLGFLSLFWTILEMLSMLFSRKSRAIHDYLAGTVVVRTS